MKNYIICAIKMLLGFLVVHTAGNIYFYISQNIPDGHSSTKAFWAVIVGLIVMVAIIYYLYFGKTKDKFKIRDFLAFISGAIALGVLIGFKESSLPVMFISLFFIALFGYLNLIYNKVK